MSTSTRRDRRFPTDIVAELGQMGLWASHFPRRRAAPDSTRSRTRSRSRSCRRVWGSLGIIVAAHTSLGCNPLHLAGTHEQKERFLVPMAQGSVLGAYGLTEPEAGSDSGGTRTTARFEEAKRNGGNWVINGAKRFITNAGQAGTYIVTARTGERDDGSPEISAFIVEQGTPGFTIGRLEEKLGLHASATGELLFEDCRIPADQMLGERGEGWKIFLKTLDGGRISIGAMAVGLSQAALDASRRLRPRAQAVRQADRLVPGRRVHDRRHVDRDRGGSADGLARGVAQGQRP